ncbi:FAD-dependent oxidoreductase [Alteromonas sp. 1_MG-2023]|uniref:FAD-dependent oxidoreductase n=1 Tax=Alteromonas sp. 1_MG-2023 TaxID=3062669 RepID=UPI0026E1CCB6|nr:FAD-dependent oxidoreductase [Alteromonas sp. 1_MG-2023]MDO6567584.1 FAD-dependent oxidoreductase [Alteromonas sp. 1_MG-2023]
MVNKNLKRREFLQGVGAGTLAASLVGCSASSSGTSGKTLAKTAFQRPFSRKPMVAPKISANNIVTEIVGHRPYRPEGFVVNSEVFGNKTLVHNYGHGGGGISLSWGSSALAVNEVANSEIKEAAIIGSGVMGLTTARLLQEAGWKVTLYTKAMPRFTTSQVAGGEWGPYSVHDPLLSSLAFKSQLQQAAKIAHGTFAKMVGSDYGIQWKELYTAVNTKPDDEGPFRQFYPYTQVLGPNEHPFPTNYCISSLTMLIETTTFLRRLVSDIKLFGGEFVIREFHDQDDIHSLSQSVLFNCTGLGSRALFNDEGILPAKGQLVLLPPDPAVDYLTVGGGTGSLYMFSRNDYMILGGTFKPGDWSTEPEPIETARILSESQAFFSLI